MNYDLKIVTDKWPSAIVTRNEVGKFTGDLLNPRTLANCDSAGIGPRRIKFGKKVAYFTEDLVSWMEGRLQTDRSG